MTEPPRRRVPIPVEQDVRAERRGFFRLAAILGVLVGIPLGVFGLPALLNLFFDEPTVPHGGSWSEDGLILWVESWSLEEGPPRAVAVTLALRSTQLRTVDLAGAELELSEGDPVRPAAPPPPATLRQGAEARITLRFDLAGADERAESLALRLREPKARFELTESDH